MPNAAKICESAMRKLRDRVNESAATHLVSKEDDSESQQLQTLDKRRKHLQRVNQNEHIFALLETIIASAGQ